jgi:hypothetical protein
MKSLISISVGNRHKGFAQPTFFYDSLENFIDNFPFSERQCMFQIQQNLAQNGCFIFSDWDSPSDFLLQCC